MHARTHARTHTHTRTHAHTHTHTHTHSPIHQRHSLLQSPCTMTSVSSYQMLQTHYFSWPPIHPRLLSNSPLHSPHSTPFISVSHWVGVRGPYRYMYHTHSTVALYTSTWELEALASFPGHSPILSRSRGENLGVAWGRGYVSCVWQGNDVEVGMSSFWFTCRRERLTKLFTVFTAFPSSYLQLVPHLKELILTIFILQSEC